MTRDGYEALRVLMGLGIPRVLTSGQERSAIEGLVRLFLCYIYLFNTIL